MSGFSTTLGLRNLASYAYTNDALGRRTNKVETGEMFSRYGPGLTTKYGYNDRSEVTSAQTYIGTFADVDTLAAGDALQGRSYHYGYDSIGNRTATTTNGQSSSYTTNNLNQIVSRTVPGSADVAGFAAASATVTVDGQPTTRQLDYFYRQHVLNNTFSPLWATLAVTESIPGGASTTENRMLYLAKSLEQFTYDLDGNVLSDGRWDYGWDAENRLISMSTTIAGISAGIPPQTLQFRYDYLGRRVEKKVYNNSTPTLTTHLKFAYSSANWHLLAEYDGLSANSLIRAYSWGLDLSRTTTGAGGVGGLLAIRDSATAASYLPAYDANGNVFALINQATGAISAAYEYSAFGETLRATGVFADQNRFRFSTKYTDSETQLVCYGKRFYNPSVGRFLGRDSIGEKGGLHLYAFCANDGVNRWDLLGMVDAPVGWVGENVTHGAGQSAWSFSGSVLPTYNLVVKPLAQTTSNWVSTANLWSQLDRSYERFGSWGSGMAGDLQREADANAEMLQAHPELRDPLGYVDGYDPASEKTLDATPEPTPQIKSQEAVNAPDNAVAPNSLADTGAANRQLQPVGKADPATAALLGQMNSNQGFLGQVQSISDKSQVAVKTETVMHNGVVVQSQYRQEYGFTGYSTGPDGIVRYDLGLLTSKPYDAYSNARITYTNSAPPDATLFVIHAHSFSSGSSDADWRSPGTYTFTIIPTQNRVEVILPGGNGGYQGTIPEVFPGLNGP